MDDYGQPQCPECSVVMRTTATAFICPRCGHLQLLDEIEMPPAFDGPEFHRPRPDVPSPHDPTAP